MYLKIKPRKIPADSRAPYSCAWPPPHGTWQDITTHTHGDALAQEKKKKKKKSGREKTAPDLV
jgi:hypothetical protein